MPRTGWNGHTSRQAWATTQQLYGTTCWLCGHPGANSTDHIHPASTHPHLEHNPTNWRPAHLAAAGHPRGCQHPDCTCPGNTGRRNQPATTPPSRTW